MYTGPLPHSAPRDHAPARRRSHLHAAAGALALLLAVACTDRTATGPELAPPAGAGPAAAFTCRADVRAGTVQCAPPAPSTPGSAAILGGQGLNVRLRSSGLSYDGSGTLRIDVTVENLTGQPLGTTDGVNPTAEGVRVFFTSGPTSATGPVEVANPTGEAFFTAAGQTYFQYDGLLAPSDTTAPLEWRFAMGPEVQSFQFTVLVAAAVPHEGGWLRMSPFHPSRAAGDSMQLAAGHVDVTGRPGATGPLQWSSADSAIARVRADGMVTGVAPGTVTITASDGVRIARVRVSVTESGGDQTPPTAHELTLSPTRLTGSGADSVTVSMRLTDGGTGVRRFQITLVSPSGGQFARCENRMPVTGTSADGTFSCRAGIPLRAESGAWTVRYLDMSDEAQNIRAAGPAQLQAAGVPSRVYVHSPMADVQAPSLTGVSITPDSILANGLDSSTVALQLVDGGTGVGSISAHFRESSGRGKLCHATAPSSGTRASGTFSCRIGVMYSDPSGDWRLDWIQVQDVTGNTLEMNTAALDSAGFPTILRVSSPPADTIPPSLVGFTFSPDTVAADGVDSVTVTMELADAGMGAVEAEAFFTSASRSSAGCTGYTQLQPRPGIDVITCRFAVPAGQETGQWSVRHVMFRDWADNRGGEWGSALPAKGFPTVLTVTP